MSSNRESGSTIVELLVGLGLLSIVITLFAQNTKTLLARRNETDQLRYRALIRDMLYSNVDCQQLKKCEKEELIDLVDKEGRVIAKSDGSSSYGPWNVRAQCTADQTLAVRLASIIPSDGRFRTDPLNGQTLDWNHPNGLIFSKGSLCGKVIGSTEKSSKIETVLGESCHEEKGTCPPPKESIGLEGAPAKMCCPDGSDMPEPKCPAPKRKVQSYWDREGDWGTNGNWVVLCH